MPLALARFNPSTVSSTVVPRAIPCGETVSSVGGVVRLPAAHAAAAQKVSNAALLIKFQRPIEHPRSERFSVRRVLKPERPIRQLRNRADLGQIGCSQNLDGAVRR